MMTAFELGFKLATDSDEELQTALADRPATLALFRQLNWILPTMNSNERQLSTLVSPPTIREYRRVNRRRLHYMQAELLAGNFPISASGSEIHVEEGEECSSGY